MMNLEKRLEDIVLNWRNAGGRGSVFIPPALNDKGLVLNILQRIYARSPTAEVIIMVPNFEDRTELIEFLTHQENEDNNNEFASLITNKILKIYSSSFVENYIGCMRPHLFIMYHCDTVFDRLRDILYSSKFRLVIMNTLFKSNDDAKLVYNYAPIIKGIDNNEVNDFRVSTPVEDIWIPITIPEDSEDYKLLKYYEEYIATTLNIFGSFDSINEARIGNRSLNISAAEICAQIAHDNGWSPTLDMSIPINVDVDNMYNPSAIKERANMVFEIIRNRSTLLADYKGKLIEVLKIVEDNPTAKILIINKRGEFASEITDYLNSQFKEPICGNYHDKVNLVPAVDVDGNPVFYKSGSKKGVRKMMAAQAQKSLNEALFNAGKLRCLATNNAPDKALTINADVIIITSPQCEDIESYLYRLYNVRYTAGKLKLYNIFVKNSFESDKLLKKQISETHTIMNKEEIFDIDENFSDFVIVD